MQIVTQTNAICLQYELYTGERLHTSQLSPYIDRSSITALFEYKNFTFMKGTVNSNIWEMWQISQTYRYFKNIPRVDYKGKVKAQLSLCFS